MKIKMESIFPYQENIPPCPKIRGFSDYISDLLNLEKEIQMAYCRCRITKDELDFASMSFIEAGNMLKKFAERDEAIGKTEGKQEQT